MLKPIKKSEPAHSLADLLRSKGLINDIQVAAVHRFMDENDTNFGTAVMQLGFVREDELGQSIEQVTHIRFLRPDEMVLTQNARALIPKEKARDWQVFPLTLIDESGQHVLMLGMTDPLDRMTVRRAYDQTRCKIQPVFLALSDLQKLYRKHYQLQLAFATPEPTSGEITVRRRMESILKDPRQKTRSITIPEGGPVALLHATISLLIRKGAFTLEEFEQAVASQETRPIDR